MTEIQKWGDKAMFEAEPMEARGPTVHLLSCTPDPLGSIAAACAMYQGRVVRSLDDITDDDRRHYWAEVQKTHLKAPLEFVDLHFMVEGVTRAFTHQMVRQRTAVYAQESLRFAVKENMAAESSQPSSIRRGSMEEAVWDGAMDGLGEAYNTLIDLGVPAEDARGLLPHAVTTRLNYKTNLRNLLDHAGNRLCTQAQFEWRLALTGMVHAIRQAGWQWRHIADTDVFRPVCYQLGHCPFTAEFDRGCTIRERVQRGEFDRIDDREWLLDPTAGVTR